MTTSVKNIKLHNIIFYSLFVSYQPIYLTKYVNCGYSIFYILLIHLTYNVLHCYILKIDYTYSGIRAVDSGIYNGVQPVKFL